MGINTEAAVVVISFNVLKHWTWLVIVFGRSKIFARVGVEALVPAVNIGCIFKRHWICFPLPPPHPTISMLLLSRNWYLRLFMVWMSFWSWFWLGITAAVFDLSLSFLLWYYRMCCNSSSSRKSDYCAWRCSNSCRYIYKILYLIV